MIDFTTPTTLTYNTVGELLTVDATAPADDVTYTWNAAGQMVGVRKGTQNITYQYNGFGQRVAETINGALTRQWLWCGGSATPCEERDAQGYLLARYFPQGEQRITGVATPVVENLHYLRDRLGSVIGLTDATGTLISRLSYDIWGRTKLEFGTVTPAFGFAGMLRDPSTGLYQTWHRYYDPNLGRWLSRDPIGEAGGDNLYGYVGNDPVNLTDPDGKFAVGAVVGVVSGAVAGGMASAINGGSWSDIATNAAIGGALGGMIGLIDPSEGVGTLVAIGALSGIAGDLAGQMLTNPDCEVNWGEVAGAGVGGALSGVGGAAFGILGKAAGGSQAMPQVISGLTSIPTQIIPQQIGTVAGTAPKTD